MSCSPSFLSVVWFYVTINGSSVLLQLLQTEFCFIGIHMYAEKELEHNVFAGSCTRSNYYCKFRIESCNRIAHMDSMACAPNNTTRNTLSYTSLKTDLAEHSTALASHSVHHAASHSIHHAAAESGPASEAALSSHSTTHAVLATEAVVVMAAHAHAATESTLAKTILSTETASLSEATLSKTALAEAALSAEATLAESSISSKAALSSETAKLRIGDQAN
jgi:hypothetical protein